MSKRISLRTKESLIAELQDLQKHNAELEHRHKRDLAEYNRVAKRITELEDLADKVKNGFQGGCWCCEVVGEKNIELQAAINDIAPWLSASLSEGDPCKEYIDACNAIFELDSGAGK